VDVLTSKLQSLSLPFQIEDACKVGHPNPNTRWCGRKKKEAPMILVRQEIGDVLRDFRLQKGRTLRQVASKASVALGYLSEVERGQKEASSEILASVADALDTPISVIMREVGDRLAVLEGIDPLIPDTVPDEFVAAMDADLVAR
jgi:transcriptional regulator with XRE-family HTH domain